MKGRIVTCSCCSKPTNKGTSQVYARLLFHFCLACWNTRRTECNSFMAKTGKVDPRAIAA